MDREEEGQEHQPPAILQEGGPVDQEEGGQEQQRPAIQQEGSQGQEAGRQEIESGLPCQIQAKVHKNHI